MRQSIRARLLEIVGTLSAVTGTRLTVAGKTPGHRLDAEGWVLWVRWTGDSRIAPDSSDQVARTSQWTIELTSPQITTGFSAQREIEQVSYADALETLFNKYPRLEMITSPRTALTGVTYVDVGNVQGRAPRAFPDGSQQQYYSVSLTLSVVYDYHKVTC